MKEAIRSLLAEYVLAADEAEARRCLRELHVPFYAHEAVKQAVVIAVEQPQHGAALVRLLHKLVESGEVSLDQLARGFTRVWDRLDDLSLDVPDAPARLRALIQSGNWAGEAARLLDAAA